MRKLLEASKDSIYFEDEKLYICLAAHPLAKGHSIVVWKEKVGDLSELPKKDFEALMDFVDVTRNTLMGFYGVDKVYLLYMDEVKQVHWHLVPRFDEKGINALNHEPDEIKEFPDAEGLRKVFKEELERF